MELFDVGLIAISAAIAGIITEAAKRAGFPGKYSGLIALAAGIIAGIIGHIAGLSADDTTLAGAALAGFAGGASAAGLYSTVKAARGGYDGIGERPEDFDARLKAGLRPADRAIDPEEETEPGL
jgi:hypothetical protein